MENMEYQYAPLKKYVYVKQQVIDRIKSGQSKVLINPNFMKPRVVHVNPHFKTSSAIHINPNVLKPPIDSSLTKSNTVQPIEIAPPTIVKPAETVSAPLIKPIITANKVIRVPPKPKVNKYKLNNKITKTPPKINNVPISKAVIKKANKKYLYSYTKNIYVKCNKKASPGKTNQKQLINIKKPGGFVIIGAERYKVGANNRTLKLLSNKNGKPTKRAVAIPNVTTNLYVKNNIGKYVLSQAKRKSITTTKNNLKKSNMVCPFYRKFGRCKGKENGTCIKIHNDDQVSICPKFLQGACVNKNCLLSHKLSAEKMPACKFFLESLCLKDDCPYLHVKINAKAEICKDFLDGFCKNGAECDQRHQYLCPEYENKGICTQKKCRFPHKTVVRKKSNPPKLQMNVKQKSKLKPCTTSTKPVPEKSLTIRYYEETGSKDVTNESEDAVNTEEKPINRPAIGSLPSFIPFTFDEFT